MLKTVIPLAIAFVAFAWTVGSTSTAEAQGIHYRSRGVHIDVGNPHGYGYHRGYRSYGYAPSYHHGGWGAYYHSGFRSRGHYDYYPPRVIPHGDHYDVIPGHYRYHRGGHGYGHGHW
jgi:hypothetical protein